MGARYKDLTGRRFGHLMVLSLSSRRNRSNGCVYWHCRCDCGKESEVSQDSLVSGNTTSCGCRKRRANEQVGSTLHLVDGTCIEWLRSRKHRSDNKSGFRGVYFHRNKYRVSIGLQGKIYYLGIYSDYNDAVNARLEGEKQLYEPVLEAWDLWQQRAAGDQQWARDNPFQCTVENKNHKFYVHTGADTELRDKSE